MLNAIIGLWLMLFSQCQTSTVTVTTRYETVKNPTPQAGIYQQIPKTADGQTKFVGKISHYNTNGCLGCSAHYDENGRLFRKTATGETLDDGAFTLAFNRLPLGSMVRILNLDNGKSAIARVNDTGGFESCCGRMADLTTGLGNYLGTKTDKSTVVIEKL